MTEHPRPRELPFPNGAIGASGLCGNIGGATLCIVPTAAKNRKTRAGVASCIGQFLKLPLISMLQNRLADVRVFRLPKSVIESTLAILQAFGKRELEGLVLWLGAVSGDTAEVQEPYVPEQNAITSESGVGYFVSGEALFRLNQLLSERQLRLLAQVHSHPGEAYHSAADDRYAIVTSEGGLSLVVPDFGLAPPHPKMWAAYRLWSCEWAELTSEETDELFSVIQA